MLTSTAAAHRRRSALVTTCHPSKPGPGVTTAAVQARQIERSAGDACVTQTVQEPSREPSSSSPAPERAPALAHAAGGAGDPLVDALDVLPEPIRDHPSVVPSAIARRIDLLGERGRPLEKIRKSAWAESRQPTPQVPPH